MQVVRKLNGCAAVGTAWAQAGPITGTLDPAETGTPFGSLIYPGTHRYPAEAPALIVNFFRSRRRGSEGGWGGPGCIRREEGRFPGAGFGPGGGWQPPLRSTHENTLPSRGGSGQGRRR